MQRYKIILEYDGSAFHGWQQQAPELSTVQACLQRAIAQATQKGAHRTCHLRLNSNIDGQHNHSPILVIGAGRTDTGVHASGQVAHFDLPRENSHTLSRLRASINHFLQPHPIAVTHIEAVSEQFHARFSAIQRRYKYHILNRNTVPILQRGKVWHIREKLDYLAMHEAAQVLIGRHDFASFCATHCQSRSKVKTLSEIRVTSYGDIIEIALAAPSFLHNQVRIITGTLILVGKGSLNTAGLKTLLERRDRRETGRTAPAEGLCLVGVDYPLIMT